MAAEKDRDEARKRAGDDATTVLAKHPCVVPGKVEALQEQAKGERAKIADADPADPRQDR